MSIKVAFIGAGGMIEAHAKAFKSIEGVELVGITNRTKEKAQKLCDEIGVANVYDDINSLYEATKADLVIMAVYEPAIEETAIKAFEFPWHVLMEKPIGINFAAAERVYKAAKARKSGEVFVGLNRRTLGSTQAALNDVNSRQDETRFVMVQDQQSLATARIIGHAENVVANWMYANSIHLVDYISAFCRGDIDSVSVLEPWIGEETERVVAHIKYKSGDSAIYSCLWNTLGPWACTAITKSRRWEMRPLEKAQFQNGDERKLNPIDDVQADLDFKPGFKLQAQMIIDKLSGAAISPCSIEDAYNTSKLLRAIYNI